MIGTDITVAVQYLNQGLTVGIPTETVYGLAANALNEDAVISIFKIKNRPFFDPLIIHVPDIEHARKYVKEIPEKAERLAMEFWPGPLTLLLKKNDRVPDIVTSGSDLVAIRVPKHPITLELLRQIDFPLAAPSANPFGYISPTNAEHVENQLGEQVSYILDGGSSDVGLESTIVNCTTDSIQISRLGGLSIEAIENCLKEKVSFSLNKNSNPLTPGQLDKHYSPVTSFILTDDYDKAILENRHKKIVVLSFGEVDIPEDIYQLNLSKVGDFDEAARNLFHYLRLLDNIKPDLIISKKLQEIGLGKAINDRLTRASQKK